MRSLTMLAILVAGPALGGELSAEKTLPLHEGRDAFSPCAASLKDAYLVAWQSGKIAPGDLREGLKFNGDIVGCRVDKAGNALDAQPFVVCKAPDLQESPRAASDGTVALVVWQDLRNGRDWDVYAARVSADGKVLDPDGFLVSGGDRNQAKPRIAWDGKTFVVVWQDFRSGKKYEVYAARVSSEGKVLDAGGLRVGPSDQTQNGYDPAVASAANGRSFLFWSCDDPVGMFRKSAKAEAVFLADGKLAQKAGGGSQDVSGAGGQNTPCVAAAGGDRYLLAWRNEHPVGRGNGDVKANALVFDGQGKTGASLTLAGNDQRILDADLAWDGGAFVAAWTEFRTKNSRSYENHPSSSTREYVFASRIAPDGKLVGPLQPVAGSHEAPAMNACMASAGTGVALIAYEKHPEKPETPITIGFRMLTAKQDARRDAK